MPKKIIYYGGVDSFWATEEENDTPKEHWPNVKTWEENAISKTRSNEIDSYLHYKF